MEDSPDLTPLDPDHAGVAAEQFVSAVMTRIAAAGNPYPRRVGPLWGVTAFARPIALSAVVVIVAATVRLVRTAPPPPAPETLAEALGVPEPLRERLAASPSRGAETP